MPVPLRFEPKTTRTTFVNNLARLIRQKSTERCRVKKRTNKKPAPDAFDALVVHLERAERGLRSERVRPFAMLPGNVALTKTARKVGEHLNPGPVRTRRVVVQNIMRQLAMRVNPRGEGVKLVLAELNDAFDGVEDLAVRSAYLVGLSRGLTLAWPGGPMHMPARKRTKRPSARSRGAA